MTIVRLTGNDNRVPVMWCQITHAVQWSKYCPGQTGGFVVWTFQLVREYCPKSSIVAITPGKHLVLCNKQTTKCYSSENSALSPPGKHLVLCNKQTTKCYSSENSASSPPGKHLVLCTKQATECYIRSENTAPSRSMAPLPQENTWFSVQNKQTTEF
jgi:hypothetical protein